MSPAVDTISRDGLFWQLMEDLSACLCAEVSATNSGELCFCGVVAGEAIDAGLAGVGRCSGAAWVRLDQVFPSTNFPDPDQKAECSTLLAATIEVGVIRNVILGNDRRNPTVDELVAVTRAQVADMSAMHRAITCCVTKSNIDFVYVLNDYQPYGPEGGIVGGMWTVTVQQEF